MLHLLIDEGSGGISWRKEHLKGNLKVTWKIIAKCKWEEREQEERAGMRPWKEQLHAEAEIRLLWLLERWARARFSYVFLGLSESPSLCLDFQACVCVVCLLSPVWLFATPGTVARKAPLSMGFPRQEDWRRVAISCSRGSSWPKDWTRVFFISCIGRRIFLSLCLGSPSNVCVCVCLCVCVIITSVLEKVLNE